MNRFFKFIFFLAMTLMGVVSMWTTYVSLHDSILPKPTVAIPMGNGQVWDCAIFALLLSVAIGMMLFALKVAIIDEQKHLNWMGVLGLTLVGFISISFNLDVLYRTADREFYISYSNQQVRSTYDQYLAQAQTKLMDKQMEQRKILARQEGEMEAEVKGLRKAPAGYGPIAKQEDYKLTVMAKQAQVEVDGIDQALKSKEKADQLLASKNPTTVEEIQQLQNELRVVLKDIGVAAGMPLPKPVQSESPLFAVFSRIFDYHTLGIKEIFFIVLAFLLDLGDICGYVLVPNKRKGLLVTPIARSISPRPTIPVFRTPDLIGHAPAEIPANGNGYPAAEGAAEYSTGERMIPPAEEA